MNKSILGLIFASVLLSSIAQILLKGGVMSPTFTGIGSEGFSPAMLRAVATNPLIILGLVFYFASAAVWLIVLAKVDVGLAYPFVGAGFVLTMILAWAVHGEVPNLARVAGALIICSGIVVLARG